MRNKLLTITLPLSIFLSFLSYSQPLSALGAPQVIVSPNCGPVDEFEVNINVNGFFANYYVQWDFLGPDDVRVMHGYFSTNSTGGFTEDAEFEANVPGTHNLLLYDDLEHDSIVDVNGNITIIPFNVPCK